MMLDSLGLWPWLAAVFLAGLLVGLLLALTWCVVWIRQQGRRYAALRDKLNAGADALVEARDALVDMKGGRP